MSNVIDIFSGKRMGKTTAVMNRWSDHYDKMDKRSILEEMVWFQEMQSKKGSLPYEMIVRGIPLFEAISAGAETQELRILAEKYARQLKAELGIE